MVKDGIRQIVGRRITHVVTVQRGKQRPREQVYLFFDDGTHYEFYSSDVSGIYGSSGVRVGTFEDEQPSFEFDSEEYTVFR